MHIYLGFSLIAFGITAGLFVPFINFLFKMKFTRGSEQHEVRKNAPDAFYKIRELQSQKPMLVTGGGILVAAVVLVMFTGLFLALGPKLGWVGGYQPLWVELAALGVTFIGFGILGFYDDVIKIFGYAKTGFFGLRMRHKLLLQIVLGTITALLLWQGLGIDLINVPLVGMVHLGWWYLPFAAFLIVGFANAFDITDGLDGLSCGLLMICLVAFWLISARALDHVLTVFIAVWLGSLLAYLYFNTYPARIMLGNVGGLAFGATLAVVGLLSGKMVAMMIVAGVFLAEGTSSLLQLFSKKFMKKRIFPIAPFHHWLQLVGWEEPKIVARAWMVGLVLAIFGVWLAVL